MEAAIKGFVSGRSKRVKPSKFRRRLTLTLILGILAAIAVGFTFPLWLRRVPDMHIIFPLILGMSVLSVTFFTLWTFKESKRFSKLAKVLLTCYIIVLSIGFVGFLVLQGLIISSAHTEQADVDALIVLGAGLRGDEPSMVLRSRLQAAIDYSQTRQGVPIIVSGGLGQGALITEAQAMFNYLSSRGIDENLIWMEGESTNTYENLSFSRQLMIDNGIDVYNATVAVVSNEFHLFRAKLIAGNAGLDAVGVAAATPSFALRVLYFIREGVALANAILA